ncbi:MAG: DUF4302 domain-containing protein [Marinilabiliaceae bacterium]|nr:DUF4302 domain-containing protein [Marinilabiliaceae bacterium]
MKKNKFLIVIGILTIILNSCLFEEKNFFDESASQRMDTFIKGATDALINAENGWSFEYFPRTDSKGYIFVMKFLKTTEVKMAFIDISGQVRADSCAFDVIESNGPLLTFNTRGARSEQGSFHWFSAPDTSNPIDGKGQEGDYEFNIIEYSNDVIKLKGKKRGTYSYLRRIPSDRTWQEHYDLIREMQNLLFNDASTPVLRFKNEILLFLSKGPSSVFEALPKGGDEVFDKFNIPFILTDYGIRLNQPLLYEGITMQSFVLNETKDLLICKENEDIWITDPEPADHLITSGTNYLAEKDKMGGKFLIAFEAMEAEFPNYFSGGIRLNSLGFGGIFEKSTAVSLSASTRVGLIKIPMMFIDEYTVQILNFNGDILNNDDPLNPDMDNNAWLFYSNVISIKDFLRILPGTYKVEFMEPFEVLNIKFTDIENPDNFMLITR